METHSDDQQRHHLFVSDWRIFFPLPETRCFHCVEHLVGVDLILGGDALDKRNPPCR
jgi:hypothetical protein